MTGDEELKVIKSIISDVEWWKRLDKLLEVWYSKKHMELEVLTEPSDIYRCQWEIKTLKKIRKLPEVKLL
jgi:hypothetical protein